MDERQFEKLARSLQHITSCPSCGARYDLADIRYFGQLGMTIFVQLTCHLCQVPVFAGVPAGAEKPQEEKTIIQEPVSYDDAVRLNKLLEDRHLDFSQLLEE